MTTHREEKEFPEGFLWGASISSMQTEGGITTSDWARAEREGVVPPIGKAVDHFNRFKEDIALVESLHLNAFRVSIEWARVEPEEGVFDEAALEHYAEVVRAMQEKNITPVVCLWHFSLPEWFSSSGGFARRDAVPCFERYVARVVAVLAPHTSYFITMNEPLVWLLQHGRTVASAPAWWDVLKTYRVYRKLVAAHKAAYQRIHTIKNESMVGVAKHNISFKAVGVLGSIMAPCARLFWNRLFLSNTARHADFIGMQYYQTIDVGRITKKKNVVTSDIGWEIRPEGIYDVVMEASRYRLPVIISESGIADAQDQYRADFIRDSLSALHRAIEDGARVTGYLHWALLDNYEFTEGFDMKFGLVAVDRTNDYARTVRESALVYADIAQKNKL